MNAEHPAAEPTREALARLLMDKAAITEPQGTDDFLHLVRDASALHEESGRLLRTTVASARNAGATWPDIGKSLGMTKQAAQKRFAPETAPAPGELDPNERILGPTTAFNELRELALAGRYGWHSVEVGTNYHRMLHSQNAWEHQRVTLSPKRVRQLGADGWVLIASGFPYTYLKRETGLPALPEPGA